MNYRTNDPDIYAVGDSIEVFNPLPIKNIMLPLAGPAQKQARAAAEHIYGRVVEIQVILAQAASFFVWRICGQYYVVHPAGRRILYGRPFRRS